MLNAVALTLLVFCSQIGPTNGVYSDLQTVTAARLRLDLTEQQDIDLFDGLLADASGYYWRQANARADVLAVPALQKATQDYLLTLIKPPEDKALFTALLSDLRSFQWAVRTVAETSVAKPATGSQAVKAPGLTPSK